MKRKWKIAAAAVCVLFLLTVAYAATGGTENDPLVTLSYLNKVFAGRVEELVEQTVIDQKDEYQNELNDAIEEWDEKVQQAIDEAGVSGGNGTTYTLVTVEADQMLLLDAGSEVILRSGAANWTAADEGGLMDTTAGGAPAAKQALAANHLYLATGVGTIVPVGTQTTSRNTGVVDADTLNVRSGPGSNHNAVGTLAKGAEVNIVASVDGWYQITSGDLSGYVSADYITVKETTSMTPGMATLLVRGTFRID